MPTPRNRLAGLLVLALAGSTSHPGVLAAQDVRASRPPEFAARGQRETKEVTFGDWQKLCYKAGGTPRLCRTSITGKFPTGQVAIRVDLIEREDSPKARLQLFVPVGMYLQLPPKLTVEQGQAQQVPYTWCLTNMCVASDVADANFVAAMDVGKTMTLDVVDPNLITVTTAIPLTQFAAVHKGDPAKTFEQQIDE